MLSNCSASKAEKITVDYSVHRPFGAVRLDPIRAQNIRSPELGLPGNVACRVGWDPTRLCSEDERKLSITLDRSAHRLHTIAMTDFIYSVNPTWDSFILSDLTKRLQGLPGQDFLKIDDDGRMINNCVAFPLLQPLTFARDNVISVAPWETLMGAIVVEIRMQDLVPLLPASEYVVGEVVVPFVDLLQGQTIEGWFALQQVGTSRSLATPAFEILNVETTDGLRTVSKDETSKIFLKVEWIPPGSSTRYTRDVERETALVIQEEMIRSTTLEDEYISVVGSSLGAINTVRGISGTILTVQNTLGYFLDTIETCRNLVSFTDPFKSSVLFLVLTVLWLILAIVPTRLVALFAGVVSLGVQLLCHPLDEQISHFCD
jgi:hypothetical protein